ncbi:MAG: FAD-dependent oxidoreductase [Proteobacteria bacterium]|nr:FAD-dependent oxidoreductase [Pseudomonadota bacterium]
MNENNTIVITIDGKPITTRSGELILEVARENGIEIPTLCYDPILSPYGSCLLCVVEIEGMRKLVTSCTTEAKDGMVVQTHNSRVSAARKNTLELLLSNHFADCVGPCVDSCPAGIDVQGYLTLAKAGKHKDALELIRKKNPFPLVCGRVCVRYCELACRRQEVESAVAINLLKRYVADLEHDNLAPPEIPFRDKQKVAVVGGGPSGLTAAFFLARAGYRVTIFEAHSQLGGMLRYGIPDYRLPQDILDKEIRYITDHGIEVKTRTLIGRDFSLNNLNQQGFAAVYLAMGARKAKKMRIDNEETAGVVGGVNFLEEVKVAGPPRMKGTVVVVGGGNTAIDAARTAIRCRASKVRVLYRRTLDEMPADSVEIKDAMDEGVEFEFLVAPLAINRQNGRLRSIRCQRMRLGEPDDDGRRRPLPVEGDTYDVVCNHVVAAIGQDCDLGGIAGEGPDGIKTSSWNTISVDDATFATNIPGVFAGGDVVSGPAAAVDAIGAGRKTAVVIDTYLKTGMLRPTPSPFYSKKSNLGAIPGSRFDDIERRERSTNRQEDAGVRVSGFGEVDRGIDPLQVRDEASRCLSCGCTDLLSCELREYAGAHRAEQKRYQGKVKKIEVDDRHPYIHFDPNKCILCGKCVRTCEERVGVSALGYINRGFDIVVRPSMEKALQDTECISCGNCIEACPTGAITFGHALEKPLHQPVTSLETVCNFCGVGCEIVFNKRDDDVWNITAKKPSAFTSGELCVQGRFGHRILLKENRLTVSRIRKNDRQRETTLEHAIGKATEGLKGITGKYGSGAFAFLISPKATNEEIFLAQKIAREVLGTNNVGGVGDLMYPGECNELDAFLGVTASTLRQEEVEFADVIVMLNSNVTKDNPVLGYRIKRSVRKKAQLVLISSTETELKGLADLWLDTRRGSNATLLRAAASVIVENGLLSKDLKRNLGEGFDDFYNSAKTSLDKAAKITGVHNESIVQLAELLADPEKNVVFVYDSGLSLEKSYGDLQAIAQLLAITGRIGRRRNGIMLTSVYCNNQGHKDMGASPYARQSGLQGSEKSTLQRGCTYSDFRNALLANEIKGFFLLGEDLSSNRKLEEIFHAAEFSIVIDPCNTESAKQAHVAIPGSLLSETAGSVTSHDRKVKAFTPVFDPPSGESSFSVLSALYSRLADDEAPSLEEIRRQIAASNPLYRRIARIGAQGSFYLSGRESGSAVAWPTHPQLLTSFKETSFFLAHSENSLWKDKIKANSIMNQLSQVAPPAF